MKNFHLKEIKMNLVLFMLAGYETTSTTLSYSTYVLAKFQEEQQKLYEEILSYYNASNDDADSNDLSSTQTANLESLNKLEYLDMFIKEVLRMYPIGNRFIKKLCY
jgi:cytochrome P450